SWQARTRIRTDALSQVPDQVRLSNLFSALMRVTPPFAQPAGAEGLNVIALTKGEMYVEPIRVGDFNTVLAQTGDLLVFPQGIPFGLCYPRNAIRKSSLMYVDDASEPASGEIEFLG